MEGTITTIDDIPLASHQQISDEFYIVSIRKFSILFFSTVDMYIFYWFYRNWKLQKIHTGFECWPVMRAIFYIFFTHSLFRKIDKKLEGDSGRYSWNHETLATSIVILSIASNILDRLAWRTIGSPFTDVVSIILTLFVGLLAVKVQRATNIACNDSEGTSNSTMTGANITWVCIGAVCWALVMIGLFLE